MRSFLSRLTLSVAARAHHARLPSAASPLCDPFALSSAARVAVSGDDPRIVGSLHAAAVLYGLDADVVVATAILDAYSKCGDLCSARKLFDDMPLRNVVSWNAMIAGYANAGMGISALELFRLVRCTELHLDADEYAVSSGLTACAGLSDLLAGSQIHGYAVRAGFEADYAVLNAAANMYFRCGDVDSAKSAMEGRENWSLTSELMMISGFVSNSRYFDALDFIVRHARNHLCKLIMIDCSILISISTVCAHLGLLRMGKQVHAHVIELGANGGNAILNSALIDMYCKCSNIPDARALFDSLQERHVASWNSLITGYIHNELLEDARALFETMPNKNVISWTAMIAGYVQQGLPEEGLRLLASLYAEGRSVQGNCFTFAIALDACSCLAALAAGKQIHAQALRTGIQFDCNAVVLQTTLIDMYSKSGNLKYARRVFDSMRKKNVVSWTTMINGYAIHGLSLDAFAVFDQMISTGLEPNEVTFVATLTACSRCGLVDRAIYFLKLMIERYNILPTEIHYTCIIDMLGRAGKLKEAWKLLEELDGRENDDRAADLDKGVSTSMLGALLAACSVSGEVDTANKVFKKMLESKKQVSDSYVALSNIYAASEMWDEVYKVREEWRKQGVGREPGLSQIEFGTPS